MFYCNVLLKCHRTTKAPSKGKGPTARRTYPPDGASSIQAHQQQDSSMPIPFSYSQLLLGDHESQVFPQQLLTSTPIHPSSTHPTFNSQSLAHPYYYPEEWHQGGNEF
ncbi:Hypothetical predicted protein [Olea europaea subsp. europaea]|uniref:Uncharacterized protein n=1 Tax=Olea europaea subsp. europaea TaxID=158383 RepID=A0A8S0RIQ4_OLEEU|nr:Hypothetical predicted protein [Olea europaea subsp. europaea]